jgi:hypothetical protein
MADLGFSHSYFSCKNYQKIAQARITKSLRIFHNESKKFGLHFFDISTIFYEIYKNQQNTLYYLRIYLSRRPLERFPDSHPCPWFTQNSLELFQSLQCGPWGMERSGAGPNSDDPAPESAAEREEGG